MQMLISSSVKRVHWLHARAQKHRWHEEVILVMYEMQWTVRYFLHRSQTWQKGAEGHTISASGQAYALRQSALWRKLADVADSVFHSMTKQYVSPVDIT